MNAPGDEQALLPVDAVRQRIKASRGKPAAKSPVRRAQQDPIAQVLVDLPLAHLDRPFDYLVTEDQSDAAVPGTRVKVRFAGQDVDGFVIGRCAESAHPGRLQTLRRVVSAEPVLKPEIAELSRVVAARYAGTRSDVLRLAIPPRHATSEKQAPPPPPSGTSAIAPDVASWSACAGQQTLSALAAGDSPRVVLTVPPGDDWAAWLAEAVVASAASGRGALACVPDGRDLTRLDTALTDRLGTGHHVVLSADAGPASRYRAFLALSRGAVKIAIGTRAAAFAPVNDLGLVAMWDDGDDLYDEPRAPYCHAREVLLERAQTTGCGVVLAAHARSVEAQYLIRTGWASALVVSRQALRERVQVAVTGDSDLDLERDPFARQSRMPREVHAFIADALDSGPVLVQTPRAGYATRLSCDRCRTTATCRSCSGPLHIPAPGREPECRWCGALAAAWTCGECGGRGLRAPVLGDSRTAEELGRAFPGVGVRTSSGSKILSTVPGKPGIVVATPGAEPVAETGFSAVVLLDTWLFLSRADLRASEEALRRWMNAASLIRPGGRVLLVGAPEHPALQAMVRWDPGGFAEREIVERQSAHLPPASRLATVTGEPEVVAAALREVDFPPGTEVLGPVPLEQEQEQARFVVRSPRSSGPALSAALRDLQGRRSARKLPHLRIEVDPADLG